MSDRPGGQREPGSLREVGASLLALVRTRFELLGLELREEALRAQRVLVMSTIAAFFLGAALVLVGVFVAVAFRDSYPLVALGLVVALFAAIGVGLALHVRSSLVKGPKPFSATVKELEEDLSLLRDRHE
jgi:uncharacterized membrane protein YqjE